MEDFFIEETETTPEINISFQEGLFEFKGVSIPEDAEGFYSPVLDAVEAYTLTELIGNTVIAFKLVYLNTSTTAIIGKLIQSFEGLDTEQHTTIVNWYYEEGDEDMKDIGSDFAAFSKLNFELIPCEEIL